MTALWIILGILIGLPLLLMLLLAIPARIYLQFEQRLLVRVRILGIPFTVFDGRREKAKTPSQETPASQDKEKTEGTGALKAKLQSLQNALKNEGLMGYVNFCRQLASYGGKLLHGVRRSFSVRRLQIHYVVAGGDADEVALRYGRICTCLYTVQALLEQAVRIKKREIRLLPDFLADDSYYSLDAIIRVMPLRLLFAACGCIFRVWGYTSRKITDFEMLSQSQGG